MQEPSFIEYIGEKVVVLGHPNADPDAVGAAQGVRELVEKLRQNILVEVVMPEDISSLSRNIIKELDLDIKESTSTVFDTIIVVDSGGINQLGAWEITIRNHNGVTILIDHHILDDDISKYVDLLIYKEDSSSTCELVYSLFEKNNVCPTLKTSKALLAGILFDTRYLSLGDSMTFQTVSKLLEKIGDISEVRSILTIATDVSEKIARLKTAQRLELHRIGQWILVFSEVGSFHASGARALISLGADFGVVIGTNDDKLRASLRSTQSFFAQTGIHLGELSSEIGNEFGFAGSGHPTAAGLNGSGTIVEFKKAILNKITEKILRLES